MLFTHWMNVWYCCVTRRCNGMCWIRCVNVSYCVMKKMKNICWTRRSLNRQIVQIKEYLKRLSNKSWLSQMKILEHLTSEVFYSIEMRWRQWVVTSPFLSILIQWTQKEISFKVVLRRKHLKYSNRSKNNVFNSCTCIHNE